MKKIKLIYNSGAGQSKFKYFLDPIIEKFMDNDIEVSIFRAANNTNLYEFLKDVDKDGYSAESTFRKWVKEENVDIFGMIRRCLRRT